MDQIIITKVDGTTWPLITKTAVSAITKAVQKRALLGEDIIDMSVTSSVPLTFNLGDHITVYGCTYTLNSLPKPHETGSRRLSYDLTWESKQYDLLKAPYFALSDDNVSISPDWSLAGDLSTFIDILINNLNDHFGPGYWVKGLCPETNVQTLTFSIENCLAALQYLCKEEIFNKEFEITESEGICTINIKDAIGQNIGETYRYGRAKGLSDLSRQTVSDKNIITKLFAFGSDKNLPSDYRGYNQRLKLPGNDKSYLEDATAIGNYGKIAGSKIFDDIFPHRTGTISSLASSAYEFVDSSMDFDLNAKDTDGNTLYLLNGTSAKIHFNTGNLAGYEFEVLAYDHSTKKFTIKAFADERNQLFPDPLSEAFQMSIGDEYVIVDILMPQSYIDTAEAALQTAAETYLAQNSQPRVQYSLKVDETFLKNLYGYPAIVNAYNIGDYLNVQDTNINVNKAIRIKSFTRDLIYCYQYTLELSDIKEPSTAQRLLASTIETEKVIANNRLRDVARAKRNWKSIGEVYDMIFDPYGYFNGERIRTETIESLMAIIGFKFQALSIDCIIEPNYQGNPQLVNISAGTLNHFGMDPARDWSINASLVTLSDPGAYYIYAKCEKVGTAGLILLSQSQIKYDDDPNYYHFLLGNLLTAVNGVRWTYLTYGVTIINGKFIRSGIIMSLDGQTYFNLDTGEIGGKIIFGSGSSGYNNLSDKPDLSDMATQTYVNGIKDLLQGQLDGQIISWFYDYDPANNNLPASDWTTQALAEQHANDTFTNTLTGGCWRWQVNGGTWQWGVISDTASQAALQLAQQALDTADRKRRVFVSQPTTPYNVGDLWSNGTDLKKCITERLTGAYNAADWGLATNYDRTITVINNGLATSGRFEVGSENFGEANAWVNGSVNPNDPDNDYRFGAGASYANRANAPFWVKNNGAAVMKGVVEFGTLPVSIGSILQNIALLGPDLWENNYDGDGSAILINRLGFNKGATRFRDFVIYDGKAHKVFALSGATPAIYIGNTVDPINVLLDITGSLKLNTNDILAASNHNIATGTNDITCGASEGDMTSMSITYTPRGTKAFVMFSAPFYTSSTNQTASLFINIGGSNVRKAKHYITSGENQISFQHLATVTPGTSYTIKIRWSGGTSIKQRGSTDSERILTIVDLM